MPDDLRLRALELIADLSHCPEVTAVWAGPASHPCSGVVGVQPSDPDVFQVPEPWAGHIHRAPLLFVSSNPSISKDEPYPTWDMPETARRDFFDRRFGQGRGQVKDGMFGPLKSPGADGSWHNTRATPFWRECNTNVCFVLGRPAVAGIDYAMTEVVHCKSRDQEGVTRATPLCMKRWFERVLAVSGASVVAVLGSVAMKAVSRYLGRDLELWRTSRAVLGGRERLVLAARHTNHFGTRLWSKTLDEETLEGLRAAMRPPIHQP